MTRSEFLKELHCLPLFLGVFASWREYFFLLSELEIDTSGPGSASRNAIGTGVIGGMLSATFLATFLIPMFFVVIGRYRVLPAILTGGRDTSGSADRHGWRTTPS
jgi:hypothetical protein